MVKRLALRPQEGAQNGSQDNPIDLKACVSTTKHQHFTLLISSLVFRQQEGMLDTISHFEKPSAHSTNPYTHLSKPQTIETMTDPPRFPVIAQGLQLSTRNSQDLQISLLLLQHSKSRTSKRHFKPCKEPWLVCGRPPRLANRL